MKETIKLEQWGWIRYFNDKDCHYALYAYNDEPDVLYLSSVYVTREARGAGLGNQILRDAEEWAITMGMSCIILQVIEKSWMHDWYERYGYAEIGINEHPKYVWMKKAILGRPKHDPT